MSTKPTQKQKKELTEYIKSILYRVVIFYGEPNTGKSTFAGRLAKILSDYFGKKAMFIWTETLLLKRGGIGEFIKEYAKPEVFIANTPEEIYNYLLQLDPRQYCMICIDSVSALVEMVDSKPPRCYHEVQWWARKYGEKLAKYIVYSGLPLAVMIMHSSTLYEGHFEGKKVKPNISLTSLKYVETVLRFFKTGKGKYMIEYHMHRVPPPDLKTGKVYKSYKGRILTHDEFLGDNLDRLFLPS